MLKKTIRRLGALAMVLAMAVSVFAVSASAEGASATDTIDAVHMFKRVNKGTHTYAPTATFSFTVANAGASEGITNPHTDEKPVVTVGTANFTPAPSDKNVTSVSKEVQINVNYNLLPAPGIYYFRITEVTGAVAGVNYTGGSKILAVYKYSDGTNKYMFVNDEKTNKIDGTFDNSYENKADLTITKTVEGEMGNKNMDFQFTLKINDAVAANKQVTKVAEDGTESIISTDEAGHFTLKHGEKIVVKGLEAMDTYEVTEDTYAGYTTSVNGSANTLTNGSNMTKSENELTSAAKNVAYVNTYTATTPTGVIMNIAPYALMVVLAGAFAVVFLSRRNRAE